MTTADLRDLLVRDLVRADGGSAARWRRAVGELKVYARATHAHCNWEVRPAGTAYLIERVERAADAIRAAYPFVDER
ncbi:hypothetical protein [Sphingomonas sp.]|uniref:hypothetical protein n=1 Tax=Sphingomonas sp. TaxID=28214 RepID=UPI003AFFE5DB